MPETLRQEENPSIDFLLTVAGEHQRAQLSALHLVTTRAVQLLGFSGIVVALVANLLEDRSWHVCATIGLVLVLVAAACFLCALLGRRHKVIGDIEAMEKGLLNRPERDSKQIVLRATAIATKYNDDRLRTRTRWVTVGTTALMGGGALLVLGIVVSTWR